MRVANIVLYTLTAAGVSGFNRQPIASASGDDPLASVVMAHAATEAYSEAKARGVPLPKLQCLREEREANEQGIILFSAYTELHPVTLAALGAAKQKREEHDPKSSIQTAEEAAYAKAKAEAEKRIVELVEASTTAALKAQQERIAEQISKGTLPGMEAAIAKYNERAAAEKAASGAAG